jgi:hypothetical protein
MLLSDIDADAWRGAAALRDRPGAKEALYLKWR